MSGPGLFVLVAVVVVLALLNQVRPLNILAFCLAGTLVVSRIWSLFSVSRLTLRRQLRESRLQVGEYVEERLTLENGSLLPRPWIEVEDHSTLPQHVGSLVFELGPYRVRTWTVRTLCSRRGEYFVGPTRLVGADPLGFFPVRRSFPESQRVLVLPRTLDLPGFEVPSTTQLGGLRRRPGFHQTTPHAAEVREYQPGDPLNRIHWLTTARISRLMVKEFDEDPTADYWLFLDLERKTQRGEGDESTEEYAVTIAASLARLFLSQGRNVGLVTTGRQLNVLPADRGDRQLLKLLEQLAVARADGEQPLAGILTAESHRVNRNSIVLAITPSQDEAWISSLRQLRMEGVSVAAVVLEANTFGGGQSSLLLVGTLAAADLPTYLVKRGDLLSEALQGDGRRIWLEN